MTDVLFADEMSLVHADYEPAKRLSEKICTRAVDQFQEFGYELRHQQQQNAFAGLSAKESILLALTPQHLKQLRAVVEDPDRLSDLIATISDGAAKQDAIRKANKKHALHKAAKEEACRLAREKWEEDCTITKRDMAEYIKNRLAASGAFEVDVTPDTIADWIKPEVPGDRKRGGRPRKRKD